MVEWFLIALIGCSHWLICRDEACRAWLRKVKLSSGIRQAASSAVRARHLVHVSNRLVDLVMYFFGYLVDSSAFFVLSSVFQGSD